MEMGGVNTHGMKHIIIIMASETIIIHMEMYYIHDMH